MSKSYSPHRRGLGVLLPRRRIGWLWVALTAGVLVNGLRLRRRLESLGTLASPVPVNNGDGEAATEEFVLVRAADVEVDSATRAAAERHARTEQLDVLDLVPADLPTDQALDLARLVDTATFRSAALAAGRGAFHASVVRRRLWERLDPPPAVASEEANVAVVEDRAAMVHVTERLKLNAPRSMDLALAPGLHATPIGVDERLDQLDALYQKAAPVALAAPALRTAMLWAGAVVSPGWAAAATAATVLQPYLVTKPLSPNLRSRRRAPLGSSALLQAARARPPKPAEDPVDARRAAYRAELAQGVERFFEPRHETCPWCDSANLVERMRTPDLTQFKPGEFVVEECRTCGLLFQNPRLTVDGLDFYYRDFYDGLGASGADFLFAQSEPSYRGRVALAQRHGSPRRWLDVGTGYGHFCVVAAGLLPETRFDGLDFGVSVEAAQQRGWIEQAHRGLFPDRAEELAGAYDVVSMHHYLEHTRDPREELAAAYTVLEPGGHLLVEVPDPESRFAWLLGKYWVPWLQPQHQQFLTVAHLCGALEAIGFEIAEVERGPVRQPVDVAGAIWSWLGDQAPYPRVPWRPEPTKGQQAGRWVLIGMLSPLLAGGLLADRILQPVIAERAPSWSNAYRVLARRP